MAEVRWLRYQIGRYVKPIALFVVLSCRQSRISKVPEVGIYQPSIDLQTNEGLEETLEVAMFAQKFYVILKKEKRNANE